ncbi:hypothetical protein LLG96_02095 [bacterium]|nr:hypothetical protein [bacterium]
MSEYTREQVEEMVQEAVEKTERSFGGTFKRLKSENEELRAQFESIAAEQETARGTMERRIAELESSLKERDSRISELAIRGEFQKQLREKGPLPERFVDMEAIAYSEDPEILGASVAEAIDKGRREFEQVLSEHGIAVPSGAAGRTANPTNPPNRDTATAHNLKSAEAREALHDMVSRGLIR